MLIERFRFRGHPGIGDVDLDFRDETGAPAPVVVLAGANATGKTAILQGIHSLFTGQMTQVPNVEVDAILPRSQLDALNNRFSYFMSGHQGNEVTLGRTANSITEISGHGMLGKIILTQGVGSPLQLVSLFSAAHVNYPTANHTGVGANDLDRADGQSRASSLTLGTEIGQLLVDIRSGDAQDTWDWASTHSGQAVPPEVLNRRSERFQRAIEFILPDKRLGKLVRTGNKIDVTFDQRGILSTFDMLSSGEQQIIVRGAFVFRDAGTLKDAVVLIDEPELSLHPDWQGKIIDFYRHVLDDGTGHHPQIICATHSPFVVHGTTNGKVIVLERTGNVVREMPNPTYPGAGALTAVRAFNLDAFVDAAEKPLLVLTEGETDVTILKTAWRKLYPDEARPFDLRSMNADKNINTMLRDDQLIRKMGSRKVVGIFDFDVAFDQWKGTWNDKTDPSGRVIGKLKDRVGTEGGGLIRRHTSGQAWAMLLPVPSFRTGFASEAFGSGSLLSIEFLFEDADFLPGMIENVTRPLASPEPKMRDSFKSRFATHVDTLDPARFDAFCPLFDRLREMLDGRL